MHPGRAPRPHARTSYALDDADLLRFGCFELRPREPRLLVDGKEATVGARAFDVLLALIEHRDRLVTMSELLDLGGNAGCRMLRGDEAPCRVVI